MKIGIIGTGEMGSLLASELVKLGHQVAIANSRGATSIKQLAENIGADAVSVKEVTKDKQVNIVSIPQRCIADLPKNIFKNIPEDAIVIDTGNYYPNLRDGDIPELVQNGIDSLWVQEQLGFPVVKVFNSILATSLKGLSRHKSKNDRIALAVSGDNIKAKEVVFNLVDELGFDSFDIGTIAQSWKQQPGSPIYCRDINLSTLKKRIEAIGDNWFQMRNVILQKRETDEALMKADYQTYLENLQQS